jgi:hypothetical protein
LYLAFVTAFIAWSHGWRMLVVLGGRKNGWMFRYRVKSITKT